MDQPELIQLSPSLTLPKARPSVRNATLYADLARLVREEGLLRRRYAYYWSRLALMFASFVGIWVAFLLLGNSWFQLVLAAGLGLLCTQVGFLGHDGAHRQM